MPKEFVVCALPPSRVTVAPWMGWWFAFRTITVREKPVDVEVVVAEDATPFALEADAEAEAVALDAEMVGVDAFTTAMTVLTLLVWVLLAEPPG